MLPETGETPPAALTTGRPLHTIAGSLRILPSRAARDSEILTTTYFLQACRRSVAGLLPSSRVDQRFTAAREGAWGRKCGKCGDGNVETRSQREEGVAWGGSSRYSYFLHARGAPIAGWSSLVARRAHNPKVVGSNPAPATINLQPGGRTASGLFRVERFCGRIAGEFSPGLFCRPCKPRATTRQAA